MKKIIIIVLLLQQHTMLDVTLRQVYVPGHKIITTLLIGRDLQDTLPPQTLGHSEIIPVGDHQVCVTMETTLNKI